jgi:hypothetical protein
MRKNNIILTLVLVFGIALFSYGSGLAGTLCFSANGCNDLKIAYKSTDASNLYDLSGWEYGCGLSDRLIYGTARVSGGTIYWNFTKGVVVSGQAGETHYNCAMTGNTCSASGFAQRLSGDFNLSDTFTIIPCPVAEELPVGVDIELE